MPEPAELRAHQGELPRSFGVITSVVSIPGTASDFWPNSGTQNEWITSTEFNVSLTGTSTGSTSWPEVTLALAGIVELPGELLCRDGDLERVRARIVVLCKHDRTDD